jgi:hypothetical protein
MLQKDLKDIAGKAGFYYDSATGNFFAAKPRCSLLKRLLYNEPVLDDQLQLFADLIREHHLSKIVDLLKKPIN